MTLDDSGEGGVWDPYKLDDVIYEQPLRGILSYACTAIDMDLFIML